MTSLLTGDAPADFGAMVRRVVSDFRETVTAEQAGRIMATMVPCVRSDYLAVAAAWYDLANNRVEAERLRLLPTYLAFLHRQLQGDAHNGSG